MSDEPREAGWDRETAGPMAEYATPDDTVPTAPADEYLTDLDDNG